MIVDLLGGSLSTYGLSCVLVFKLLSGNTVLTATFINSGRQRLFPPKPAPAPNFLSIFKFAV